MPLYPTPSVPSLYTPRTNGLGIPIGDSTVQGQATNSSVLIGDRDWWAQACMASGGALRYRGNAGLSGNTSLQTRNRIVTDVISLTPKPKFCMVMIGINDILTGGNAIVGAEGTGSIASNLIATYNALLAAGIEPIPCMILPNSNAPTPQQKISVLNAWIAAYAYRNGLRVLNMHDVLLDSPSGGNAGAIIAADAVDSTHPNAIGARLLSAYVAGQFAAGFPASAKPWLVTCPNDFNQSAPAAASFVTNALNLTDTNADGLCDGWGVGGTLGVNVTATNPAATGDVLGKWQKLTWIAGTPSVFQGFNPTYAVGDRMKLSCRVTTVVEGTGGNVNMQVRFNGNATQFKILDTYTADITNGWIDYEFVVPSGATNIQLWWLINGGVCSIQWAQLTIVNLTALGIT